MSVEPEVKADSAIKPEIGSLIADRYRVLDVLGRGGMGVVYKAQQIHMSKVVALKMLLQEGSVAEHDFLRFRQEARAAGSLNHPHIVGIHEFDVLGQHQAYLVMDYLDGVNLSTVFKDQGTLSIDRFERIFRQACDALQHAHQHGVVHRDIKPSNLVLVERDGQTDFLVIVDFGLVKLMTGEADVKLTSTNTLVGSPLYMSPEQCRGLPVDHRTDIYSLGCVMYEALAGCPPVLGSTALDTLYKHISESPRPMQEANPKALVPVALERVIFKALAKDPEQRQQSMKELQDDISAALHGQPGRAAAASALGAGPLAKSSAGSLEPPAVKPAARLRPAPDNKRPAPWLMPLIALTLVSAVVIASLLLVVNKLAAEDARLRAEAAARQTAPPEERPAAPAGERSDKVAVVLASRQTPPAMVAPVAARANKVVADGKQQLKKEMAHAQKLLEEGDSFFAGERWQPAFTAYSKCLALQEELFRSEPELLIPILSKLSVCSDVLGDNAAAAQYLGRLAPLYERRPQLIASDEQLLKRLADLSERMGNLRLCSQLLTAAITSHEQRTHASDRDSYSMRMQLAKVLRQQGNLRDCETVLKQVWDGAVDYPAVRMSAGSLLARQLEEEGRSEEAQEYAPRMRGSKIGSMREKFPRLFKRNR